MKTGNAFDIASDLIKNGYFYEGEEKLNENINNNCFPVLSKIELSKLLGCLGRTTEAISLLNEIKGQPNKRISIYKILGTLEELRGNVDAAKENYKLAINIDSAQPLWVYYGAKITRHDLVIDKSNKLLFAPIPKCASSSVKSFILKHTKNLDTINPHKFYENPFFNTRDIDHNQYNYYYKFTIIRDPIERFLSYYNKNIMQENSLVNNASANNRYMFGLDTKPEINFLVENFHRYAFVFNDFRHHTLPQSAYLNELLDYLDDVFTLDDLNILNKKLSKKLGVVSQQMPQLMKSNKTIENLYPYISHKTLEKLFRLYEKDYNLLSNYINKETVVKKYYEVIDSDRERINKEV